MKNLDNRTTIDIGSDAHVSIQLGAFTNVTLENESSLIKCDPSTSQFCSAFYETAAITPGTLDFPADVAA